MTEQELDIGVPSDIGLPPDLIDAVLHLVSTGPVPLGGYSLAEMVAVDAVVDFLDEMPSEAEVGEAVRSLAARQLLVALPETESLQVRGDLGIAVVFQQRARSVIDVRVTGTEPGQPWRTLLLPQPEGVALEVLIDALGVHELSLRGTDEALRRLRERLPNGEAEHDSAEPSEVLATAERSALLTVTHYSASGSTETADLSADIVLAQQGDRLYVFTRDPEHPERLVSQGLNDDEVIELARSLAIPDADRDGDAYPTDSRARSGRIAKVRNTIMRRLRRG
ncbi:MAG TPA: hypothetical protein VFY56_07735 [Propionibacteriaceae bacterium]|nr:hypothetical protein [Propionibacteriaceae bacterium]